MGAESLFCVGDNIELWLVLQYLCVLVLAVFVVEVALHRLEHAVARSPKFEKMASKVYRELMVLGLVGFVAKIVNEANGGEGEGEGSQAMLALEIADLMIFILALALLLQATGIFVRLRKHDRLVERAELMTAGDLVEWSAELKTKEDELSAMPRWRRWGRLHTETAGSRESLEKLVKFRLLRRYFLQRFNLPELFPFAKYLRKAQDNQVTHMVDVELSTWIVLLAIAWALDALARGFEASEKLRNWTSTFLVTFVLFAWALVLLHVVVWRYFLSCVHKLLHAAGYTTNHQEMRTRLTEIAHKETAQMASEVASDALNAMEKAQELHHQQYEEKLSKRHRLLQFDTGFQLIATLWRNIKVRVSKRRDADHDARSEPVSVEVAAIPNQPPIHIRWFSRKAWHLLIIMLLMLNGFYLALLIQCGMHQFDLLWEVQDMSLTVCLAVALVTPLALNAILLQPRIFRHYVIVSNIFRIDAPTLGEVVAHFNEIVELRSEFVTAVSRKLQTNGKSLDDLRQRLITHDVDGSGEIELSKLYAELKALGLQISMFRFDSVVKLMFTIKGMRVQYAEVVGMLELANNGDFPLQRRRLMLGRRFGMRSNDSDIAASFLAPLESSELRHRQATEEHEHKSSLPPMGSDAHPPRPALSQGDPSYRGTSSRTLRQLYQAGSSTQSAGVQQRR